MTVTPIAELDVIQADRDAAADFLESWEPGPEMTVVKLARAFAEHRLFAWQPISTAPKDGTRIIVAKFGWVHTAVEDIFKEDAPKIWHLCFATTAHFLSDRGYWTDGLERLVEPTHWLALPTPPQPEARS